MLDWNKDECDNNWSENSSLLQRLSSISRQLFVQARQQATWLPDENILANFFVCLRKFINKVQ